MNRTRCPRHFNVEVITSVKAARAPTYEESAHALAEKLSLKHRGVQTQKLWSQPILSVDQQPRLMIVCLRAGLDGDCQCVGHTPFCR